ncbi:helix-turn-helix domain-containing protein [Streptodolium elevatio]
MADEEFAALLRELKDRSGLSYGVLGKRLHLSGSTLHRYVNGDAVPLDYAPVERFARICGATPEELVELHRRWVRADVLRQRKGAVTPQPDPAPAAPIPADTASGTPTSETPASEGPASETPASKTPTSETSTSEGRSAEQASASLAALPTPSERSEPNSPSTEPAAGRRRRRRTVALAGVGTAAAAVSVALMVNLLPGGDDGDTRQSVGATPPPGGPPAATSPFAGELPAAPGPVPGDDGGTRTGAPGTPSAPSGSASASASGSTPPRGNGTSPRPGAAETVRDGSAPTVAANPYKWETPCSQHYLVNRKPAEVPPPPTEQDARGWVSALGGVASGDQMLALTVQGTGEQTVVVTALHVRVIGKQAPLGWNDYVMGVGCGGEVSTKSFDVDLDAGRPDTVPKSGQRDFPYKVSESDPEVFYVSAHSQAHDVSWYLELEWSSGDRRGSVRIDDHGKPFRTSGNIGRPIFQQPIGSTEWTKAPEDEG